ncbi:MAG TPA: LysR family transcriptional regulator [Segeticoccus sp.]|nr:LysR family transcriptional regulator [Segeticoccus sp.]
MDVRHLLLLRDLAERGSVHAVAAATHRTPSAVSQQLKVAARELGAVLVEPSGRGLRLTDAGRLLADSATDVAAALERAEAAWQEFRGSPAGTVSMAMLPSAATFLLPDVLADVESVGIGLRCHDVDVAELEFAALVADHDIVLAHSLTADAPAGTGGLAAVHLVREPLDIALPRGHRLAGQAALRPEELVDEDWIGVPAGFPFDTVLQGIERRTGRTLRVCQRLKDNRLIEALVGAGHGVAVLPRFTTPTDGDVVLRPLREVPTGRHVFAVMRRDRAERRAVRWVRESLVRAADRAA